MVTLSSSTATISVVPAPTAPTPGNFNTPKINKLHDRNWLAWKTRIATVLKWKDTYDVAIGTVDRPLDPVAAAKWRVKDLIAQELITTTIRDEQVIHVSECETSAQMWQVLHVIHEPRGQQSILSTKKMLYSAEAREDADIPSHLNNMRLMQEHLTLTGHIIDDFEFKSIFVASLPRSWEGFTTSYLGYQGGTQGNKQAQTMTIQELMLLLIKEFK